MFNLAVFASGNGSNCRAILNAIEDGKLEAKVALVVTNRSKAGVVELARTFEVPCIIAAKKQFADEASLNDFLLERLSELEIDLIVLAGYLQKVDKAIIDAYPTRILNIHPALLPAFGGKGMYGRYVHEAVIDCGVKVSGITIHFVDEEYDHGPIVMQKTVDVLEDDTPETLAAKIQRLEHEYYCQAIQAVVKNRVIVTDRKTFFVKRT